VTRAARRPRSPWEAWTRRGRSSGEWVYGLEASFGNIQAAAYGGEQQCINTLMPLPHPEVRATLQ
jgi:hypothetical protein